MHPSYKMLENNHMLVFLLNTGKRLVCLRLNYYVCMLIDLKEILA